jgi:hypothetical protein
MNRPYRSRDIRGKIRLFPHEAGLSDSQLLVPFLRFCLDFSFTSKPEIVPSLLKPDIFCLTDFTPLETYDWT